MKKALMGADSKTSLSLVINIIRYSAPSCLLCPRSKIFYRGIDFFTNFEFDSAPDEIISVPLKMESAPNEKKSWARLGSINFPCFKEEVFEIILVFVI